MGFFQGHIGYAGRGRAYLYMHTKTQRPQGLGKTPLPTPPGGNEETDGMWLKWRKRGSQHCISAWTYNEQTQYSEEMAGVHRGWCQISKRRAYPWSTEYSSVLQMPHTAMQGRYHQAWRSASAFRRLRDGHIAFGHCLRASRWWRPGIERNETVFFSHPRRLAPAMAHAVICWMTSISADGIEYSLV